VSVTDLPAVNAALNSVALVLLVAGYRNIRRRNIAAHRVCMVAAFCVSALFLVSYLTYHFHVGSVPFQRQGWVRPVYFTILVTHIILAATIVPLALVTIYRAWKGRFEQHRRIARWTLPVWMYVSVTGVVIYLMLYHL
jgi:putative membrane protein